MVDDAALCRDNIYQHLNSQGSANAAVSFMRLEKSVTQNMDQQFISMGKVQSVKISNLFFQWKKKDIIMTVKALGNG